MFILFICLIYLNFFLLLIYGNKIYGMLYVKFIKFVVVKFNLKEFFVLFFNLFLWFNLCYKKFGLYEWGIMFLFGICCWKFLNLKYEEFYNKRR